MQKLKIAIVSLVAAAGIAGSAGMASAQTVQPGDTLSGIAAAHHTTYQHLAKINGIKNPDLIFVGQHINTGDGASSTPVVPKSFSYHKAVKEAPKAPAQSAPAASVSGNTAWDTVASCESGSRTPGSARWNLSYGDATSTGGLQIQTPTWLDYGGGSIAPEAYQASRAQQIQIAEKILAGQGPGAWTCNAIMGSPLG